jgi:hypothetical protein
VPMLFSPPGFGERRSKRYGLPWIKIHSGRIWSQIPQIKLMESVRNCFSRLDEIGKIYKGRLVTSQTLANEQLHRDCRIHMSLGEFFQRSWPEGFQTL